MFFAILYWVDKFYYERKVWSMNSEYYHDYYYNQGLSIDNKNALQCLQNYQPSMEKSSYFHYSAKSDGWRSPSPNSFRSSSPEFIPLTSSMFTQLPVTVEIKQIPTHKTATASVNCFYVKKETVSDLENQISNGSVFTHESIDKVSCENVKNSKNLRLASFWATHAPKLMALK